MPCEWRASSGAPRRAGDTPADEGKVCESVSHYHIGRLSLKSTGPRIQAGTIASGGRYLASTKTARSRCRWFSPSAVAC